MEQYKNWGGQSNVLACQIGSDSIKVKFKDGHVYLYTNVSAGSRNIEIMKSLASAGSGLNNFINTSLRKNYASKS